MTTAATHIKKLLNLKFFDGYLGLIEPIETLIKERDSALERASGVTVYDEGLREAMQRIARACGKTFTVDIGYDNLPELVEELLARPDATQPQPFEIRYVLHGDIQPCSVLYSDDTTTLLRLDEGDMMCETDTIEWSDSVTYRCQELLKSVDVRSLGHVAPRLAQLVRDERILLNDNGDDEAVETFDPTLDERTRPVWRCTECLHDFNITLDLCPQCLTPKQER